MLLFVQCCIKTKTERQERPVIYDWLRSNSIAQSKAQEQTFILVPSARSHNLQTILNGKKLLNSWIVKCEHPQVNTW